MILVATYVSRYKLVHCNMPCLSNPKDSTNSYSTNHCDASPAILQSLHGHYAYALVKWLQVYCSRPLFLLSGIDPVEKRIHQSYQIMDIIYRWGCLLWIVTDNGPTFLAALQWLEKHYGIKHIRISGYNFYANGMVECAHYNAQEAVFKACDGDENQWSAHTYSVFWAEHVTIW